MQSLTSPRTAPNLDLSEASRRALETFARVSLGLIFFVAGLDGFLDVLPHPSRPLPERALQFAGALLKSGYFLPMLKGTELVAGLLFLSNRLVPLAVAVIAPVLVNMPSTSSSLRTDCRWPSSCSRSSSTSSGPAAALTVRSSEGARRPSRLPGYRRRSALRRRMGRANQSPVNSNAAATLAITDRRCPAIVRLTT